MRQQHLRDFTQFPHRVRQLRQHAQPGEPGTLRRVLGGPAQGRADHRAGCHPALRSGSQHVSGRPIRERDLPGVQDARINTAIVARSAARRTVPTDLIDPKSTLSGATPVFAKATHLFVNIEQAARRSSRSGRNRGGTCSPRSPITSRGTFSASRCRDWDVSRPAPVLRLRDSRQPGQLLVRLVRRTDRLSGLDAAVVRSSTANHSRLVAQPRDGGPPLHRQGHHLLPHALLAGHAQDGRLQPADEGPHPRLSDGRRREDVEVQGDVHPGRHVPQASRSGVSAVLLRVETRDRTRRPRPESRRVRDQGQFGPGRQGREPGQPHGQIPAGRPAFRALSRRRRPVRPGGRRRRADRRGLRGVRLQRGDAADHGLCRSGQQVRRRSPALDAAERSVAGKRAARRLHDRPQPVPPVGDLPGPRAARTGRADGEAFAYEDRAGRLGSVVEAAGRDDGRRVSST